MNLQKKPSGLIIEGFTYLGYFFNNYITSVREKSIRLIYESIIAQFTFYKHSNGKKNIKLLEWTLNLRITGCIYNRKRYGWLQFFSQLTDKALLHKLDKFISYQIRRFKIPHNVIRIKKFLRSWYEINKNISRTNYIPNIDKFSIKNKREILKKIYRITTDSMDDENVNKLFNKLIYKTILELEKDVGIMS